MASMSGSRLAAVLAVVALLLVAVVAASGESAVPSEARDLPLTRGTGGGVVSGPSGPSSGAPIALESRAEEIGIGLGVLAAVLLVVAAVVAVLDARRRRGRVGVGDVVDRLDDAVVESTLRVRLAGAVRVARDRLARSGGAPDSAVIEAWLTLENAAAAEGTAREPHQTSTEFTTALLATHTTDEPALHELRALYQRARFSDDTTDADAARAVDALDRILAALRNETTSA